MVPLFEHVLLKKTVNGEEVKSIIWDDMMREWEVKELKVMAKYVDPMVWAYVANLDNYHHFPKDLWDRYSQSFQRIWLASSFKGALKPWSNFVPTQQHLDNHLSWLKIVSRLKGKGMNVLGIALTGWSRFDHYGPLCELLPAGIPTLALCLAVLGHGKYSEDIHNSVSENLGFKKPFKIHIPSFKDYKPEEGSFPGSDVYKLIGAVDSAMGGKDWTNIRETGWTRPFQIKRNHLSYFHMNTTRNGISKSIDLLAHLKDNAMVILGTYFIPETVNEWVEDKIDYYIDLGKNSLDHINDVLEKGTFY